MNVKIQMIADQFLMRSDHILNKSDLNDQTKRVLKELCKELNNTLNEISFVIGED